MLGRAFPFLLLFVAVTALGACGGGEGADGDAPGSESTGFSAGVVTPPFPKPDAILTDQNGTSYDIVAETEGFVVLFYVGYTHCPDVCPSQMFQTARVMDQLPQDVADRIKVIFLTADPERDTPKAIKQWIAFFNESFVGLTGTQAAVDEIQELIGLPPTTRTDLGGGNYAVSHSAFVLVYGYDNLAHLVFPVGMSDLMWLSDITKLVREGWTFSNDGEEGPSDPGSRGSAGGWGVLLRR